MLPRKCHSDPLCFLTVSCFFDEFQLRIWDTLSDRDNSKLCSCGGDRQIFYWDVSTGRVIRKFRGHDGEVCLLWKKIQFCINFLIGFYVSLFWECLFFIYVFLDI